MDDASTVAASWLSAAARLGWGIEGPRHADRVQRAVASVAHGEVVDDPDLVEVITTRELDTRPVDALFEAAGLLVESQQATGTQRVELRHRRSAASRVVVSSRRVLAVPRRSTSAVAVARRSDPSGTIS